MMNPLSKRERHLCLLVVALLVSARSAATSDLPIFRSLSARYAHIFPFFSLYPIVNGSSVYPDTMIGREGTATSIVHFGKNGDIMIKVPVEGSDKYRVRFFESEDHFLFEVRQIRDSVLVIEKVNFGHAGSFRYEVYKENQLLEKSSFIIRKE